MMITILTESKIPLLKEIFNDYQQTRLHKIHLLENQRDELKIKGINLKTKEARQKANTEQTKLFVKQEFFHQEIENAEKLFFQLTKQPLNEPLDNDPPF